MKISLYTFLTCIIYWSDGVQNINEQARLELDYLTNLAILNNVGSLSNNALDINSLRNAIIANYVNRNGLNHVQSNIAPSNAALPPPTTTPLPETSAQVVTLGKTGTVDHETALLAKTPHHNQVPIQQQVSQVNLPIQQNPGPHPIVVEKPVYIRLPYPVVVPQKVEVKVPVPVYIKVPQNTPSEFLPSPSPLQPTPSPLPPTLSSLPPLPFGPQQFVPNTPQLLYDHQLVNPGLLTRGQPLFPNAVPLFPNTQQLIPGAQQFIPGSPQLIPGAQQLGVGAGVGLNSIPSPVSSPLPPAISNGQKTNANLEKSKRNGDAAYGLLSSYVSSSRKGYRRAN